MRWTPDLGAEFDRRMGESPEALGVSADRTTCPDVWRMDNGDYAAIGPDITDAYADRLPTGMAVDDEERMVGLPEATMLSAAADIVSTHLKSASRQTAPENRGG